MSTRVPELPESPTPAPEATLRVPQSEQIHEKTLRVPTQNAPAPNAHAADSLDLDATRLVSQAQEPPSLGADSLLAAPLVAERVLPLGVLAPGTRICGDCTVRETVRAHESARPGLYDCDSPFGRVMVKFAAQNHPPRPELLEKLPHLRHPALIITHRVGQERGFSYEIQEFCEGGTLDDCVARDKRAALDLTTIERGIIAPFFAGIDYLHRNGIVHRDIKPKNLYLRKREGRVHLTIGDFDISSVIETNCTSRNTARAAGTHFYMAPEAFPRFVDPSVGRAAAIVTPASDYYSFGVVLVELLLGTTSLHTGRWSDVYDFYMAGGRLEIPDEIPERLRELMGGLLIRNRRERWGAAECARWLANTTTSADRQKIRDDIGYEIVKRAARPYNVFKSHPVDLPALALAMQAEPLVAEEELLTTDVLINWIGELDVKIARAIARDRDRWRYYPRTALTCALLRLDPTLPFTVSPGKTIVSLDEFERKIADWVRAGTLDLGIVVNRATLYGLENWLRLKTDPDEAMANGLEALRAHWWDKREGSIMNPVDVRIAWEEMRCWLDPDRPFTLAAGVTAQTPREIARLCYGENSDWENGVPSLYRNTLERWREGWLGAWLRQRARDSQGRVSPVVEQIEALRFKDHHAPEVHFETVLRILEPTLPRVQLRFLPSLLDRGLTTESGEFVRETVRFEAVSPGLVFGAWTLKNAPSGLRISPSILDTRRGVLEVTLDARGGLEAGSAGQFQIELAPGTAAHLEKPLKSTYKVRLPDSQRNTFVRNGALIGAGIAGGTRLVAYFFTGPHQEPGQNANAQNANPQNANAQNAAPAVTPGGAAPDDNANDALTEVPASYIGAGMTMILGAVIAFYVWLDALRRYAQK